MLTFGDVWERAPQAGQHAPEAEQACDAMPHAPLLHHPSHGLRHMAVRIRVRVRVRIRIRVRVRVSLKLKLFEPG